MGEAKKNQARDAELEAQMEKLRPRFAKLASDMQAEGCDPVAIAEAGLTVATSNMIAVRGPQRTAHALGIAATGLAQGMQKPAAKSVN